MRMRASANVWTGVVLLALAGCGVREEDRVPVRGHVRYQGRPINGGVIALAPDPERGTANELAIGKIQPDGSYQLRSDQGGMVLPGWYRATIVAGLYPKLPDKYRDPQRSDLQCEIQKGHENILDFNLK